MHTMVRPKRKTKVNILFAIEAVALAMFIVLLIDPFTTWAVVPFFVSLSLTFIIHIL